MIYTFLHFFWMKFSYVEFSEIHKDFFEIHKENGYLQYHTEEVTT